MINYAAACDVQIKMSSASSPLQNGIVERHHATADNVYEKVKLENPSMSNQEAIDYASFAKNSEVKRTGFSPLQLMMGRNPGFPGLSEANPASSNIDGTNKYIKALIKLDSNIVKWIAMKS